MRTMRDIFEGISRRLGTDKFEFKGKKGHWRTVKGNQIFFPDDGSAPMGMPKEMQNSTKSREDLFASWSSGGKKILVPSASDVGLSADQEDGFREALNTAMMSAASMEWFWDNPEEGEEDVGEDDRVKYTMDTMHDTLSDELGDKASKKISNSGWKTLEKLIRDVVTGKIKRRD